MRRHWLAGWLTVTMGLSPAAIVDRIAVTVDRTVITQSDIVTHLRVMAFLNQAPVELTPQAKKEAARRLVEQVLVRREMELSRYPLPAKEEVDQLLAEIGKERGWSEEDFRRELEKYGITEEDLRQNLALQLAMVRFVDYRFRPGISVTDQEIEAWYREHYAHGRSSNPGQSPPPLEEVRDQIEEALLREKANEQLDAWLEQAAAQARIVYHEEVFQ